jgi:hypothetical protein
MVKTNKMPATPRATQRNAKTHVVTHVRADDIRRRAYSLFQARGSEHGRDVEDWFVAEAELLTVAIAEITSTSPKTQRRLE